ncbi:MAG: phosphopantetheine-binding protein [Campylobacterales bacterium]
MMEEFKQFLIDSLGLEDIEPKDIGDNDTLFGDDGLGLDSVDSIELVIAIGNRYNVKITDDADYNKIFSNVSSLYNYINSQ